MLELNAAKPLDKNWALLLSRGRFQAVHTLLKDLERELDIHIKLPKELDKLQQLKVFQSHKKGELTGVNAQLRVYQQQGVDWLHALFQHQLGGVLADDMGLGKTLQILAFLWQCKCRGQLKRPVLVLAPTSVLSNWQSEIQTFTPGLKSQVLHGPKRHQYFSQIADNNLIITSYPLLIRDLPLLLGHPWQMLILDEAQAIKNANSLTSKAVREFNATLNYLLDMLDEMLEQGRKILLFSQFTSLLSLLEGELKRKNIKYALLTGQTRKRDEQIKRFQQGQVFLFLISLKAGGSGLNLTQADTVIHYDPWWNPATEQQATDRAHRIGQNKSVMVYKLIAANTIEEKIVELQKNKQNIADNLLQGASQQNFNRRDLNSLLQLLEIEI